jgi:hypothetical protein
MTHEVNIGLDVLQFILYLVKVTSSKAPPTNSVMSIQKGVPLRVPIDTSR